MEKFPLNYSTRSINVKEKIVQGCGPFNINYSSFLVTFEVRRLSEPVHSTNKERIYCVLGQFSG